MFVPSLVILAASVCSARRYASAVYAVIVRLSVRLSVTRRYCTKTAKHITRKQRHTITQGLVFKYSYTNTVALPSGLMVQPSCLSISRTLVFLHVQLTAVYTHYT